MGYFKADKDKIAFGPVPSRRLGKSLGINNIPNKYCSYDCIYCQVGRTINKTIKRQEFYKVEDIVSSVKKKVHNLKNNNEKIDYITYVPDGEPTLDINLKKEVEELKKLDIPIAIITNTSLMYREDVRNDLMDFNLVSLKVNTVEEEFWKIIDRPHDELNLKDILEGILTFKESFKGKIITETMLLDGINYTDEVIEDTAKFLKRLSPNKCYISIPIRPPAEKIKPASEEIINKVFQIFSNVIGLDKVEYLIGYEGNEFAYSGNIEEDLLSITSVHPMRKEGVEELLKKANANWDIVDKLIKENKLIKLKYGNNTFYMRKLKSRL
ncbi:radical SAM protein [Methanothermococcus okinawensis]|uniref:Radical SAM domain protein n=1 Tax=Methanothermococcus okinawensis (strain DSM 14208 / JCM 11175 / IH1) TaxID=647113 RepID=F8AMR0_METOI|nr:radical SAM protein [Methanothermococcus okinawensis]AEH06891.1 Radical SAM domain protein [Methanothermococcus okinawensis IH1]